MKISVPNEVAELLYGIEQAGYEAWLVGGCVRDSLLSQPARDWDIASSATPQQLAESLNTYTVIPSGLQHGTVTVATGGQRIEVTTFRSDGVYSDHRRPDSVIFGNSLPVDLARRDFTVNAMAYHPQRGLADFYGGLTDLRQRLIRAVGEPDMRFNEDGLRIMRGLRFAATLDFAIETDTAQSIQRNSSLLQHIAAERLQVELLKLLCGSAAHKVLRDFPRVIGEFIPEILPMVGFCQQNPWHHLDAWQHTLLALELAPADDSVVRLAAFFHDIGKPGCFKLGEDNVAHFYGHPQEGAELTRRILRRLRCDKATTHDVRQLVFYHDADIPSRPQSVRRWLNRIGKTQLRRLLALKRADTLAHHPQRLAQRLAQLEALTACVERVLGEEQCYSLRMLAVDGRDILALGLKPGPDIGRILNELLRLVIAGDLANERQILQDKAKELIEDRAF